MPVPTRAVLTIHNEFTEPVRCGPLRRVSDLCQIRLTIVGAS